MSPKNVQATPRIWSLEELQSHAQISLEEFVERRLNEPQERYTFHIRERRTAIQRLLKALSSLDRTAPDREIVQSILLDDEMFSALRYFTGPPISADDLAVLVTKSTKSLTKTKIRNDSELSLKVLDLICRLADPLRFQWVRENRPANIHELKDAIRITETLHAVQTLQTERRSFGKELERILETHLIKNGFEKQPTRNRGKIEVPNHYPASGKFFGECTLYSRKADLLIRLSDGRILAVEAKVSASKLNSVKRVLNDTAAKAKHWHSEAGNQVVPIALLYGVFGADILLSAQNSGLFIVWAHDVKGFVDWIKSQ